MNHRTIFIWDIHWCFEEFKLLIEKLEIKENDIIYIAWDFINRWPDSYWILKFLYKNQNQYKTIIGNNEVNFIRWLDWEYPWHNPESFVRLRNLIWNEDYLINFIRNLALYIEEKDFILIHGGKLPNKKIKDHSIDEITRLRELENGEAWYNYYTEDKKIIYGHRALDWLRIRKNTIWLDSWCIYWKRLSAYILETWEIIQQSALDIYVNVYENKPN